MTFDSAVDEGAYLNDLTLPSSSQVKNRGISKEEEVEEVDVRRFGPVKWI